MRHPLRSPQGWSVERKICLSFVRGWVQSSTIVPVACAFLVPKQRGLFAALRCKRQAPSIFGSCVKSACQITFLSLRVLFAKAVKNYDMLPLSLVNFFAIVIPMMELVAGLMLIFGIYKKGSAMTITVLLLLFLVALIQAAIRGLDINCGCFSVTDTSTKSDLIIRIVEDVFLLAGVLIILFFHKPHSEKIPLESEHS